MVKNDRPYRNTYLCQKAVALNAETVSKRNLGNVHVKTQIRQNLNQGLTRIFADDPTFVVLLDVLPDGHGQLVLEVGHLLDRNDLAAQVGALGQREVKVSAVAAQGSIHDVGFTAAALELESSSER